MFGSRALECKLISPFHVQSWNKEAEKHRWGFLREDSMSQLHQKQSYYSAFGALWLTAQSRAGNSITLCPSGKFPFLP